MLIPVRIESLVLANQEGNSYLILRAHNEKRGDGRVVPIHIGNMEARLIGKIIEGTPNKRPLPYDLLETIISLLNARISQVAIVGYEDQIFYAQLQLDQLPPLNQHALSQGISSYLTIDARPSDAIALALKFKAPLLIEEEVLDRAGCPYIVGKGKQEDLEVLEDFKVFLDELDTKFFDKNDKNF